MVLPDETNRLGSSTLSISPVLEQLEPRLLLSASPSPFEQEMLWLINDMRTFPEDHLGHFITGYGTPAASSDTDIDDALDYFGVVGSTLQADWSTLTATAPVAWSPLLDDAAEFHSQTMIDENDQAHVFPPGPDLGQRVDATGYDWRNLGENIFAYAKSALHGHAGFVVDWGGGVDGMQSPPGHRNNIMNPLWVHTGIASLPWAGGENDVGPNVVTQDFGRPWSLGDPYLVGTIWTDADGDRKFDGGEGFGGVTVTAVGPTTHSTTSWASGGYQMQLPPGAYDVTISGGAFPGVYSAQVTIDAENVKLDANSLDSQVVARHIFYNNSIADGNDPAAGASDDAAIAPDKTPLLPGGSAGAANRTAYWRGINGLMVDMDDLSEAVTAADFEFRVNSPVAPDSWIPAPEPESVTIRGNAGVDGADRITIIWADRTVLNQWIEVTVKANANTNLDSADVFYAGNAVGDIDGDGTVGASDLGAFVSEFGLSGAFGDLDADLNIDGRADLTDFAILRGVFGDSVAAPVFPASAPDQTVRFAVIGDYGLGSPDEAAVADMVDSWTPDFVITTGDNRYAFTTFDEVVGRYYDPYLTDVQVGPYCAGGSSPINAFFPSLGNHDYTDAGGIDEYLDYFTLPGAGVAGSGTSGSERYYDFVQGPIHFFVLDSDKAIWHPTDMVAQKSWLQTQLAASTAPWQIVYMHHPPYSSGWHGSSLEMQWPFADWGADIVLSGHDHTYERLEVGEMLYFVNGVGGSSRYNFREPLPASRRRYADDFGAMLVTATSEAANFRFMNVGRTIIDEDTHLVQAAMPSAPVGAADAEGLTDILDTYEDSAAPAAHGPALVPSVEYPLVAALADRIPANSISETPHRIASADSDLRLLGDDPPTGGETDLLADLLDESLLAVRL